MNLWKHKHLDAGTSVLMRQSRSLVFSQNEDEPYVYKKVNGSAVVFLVLYVDDILLMGNDVSILQSVKI